MANPGMMSAEAGGGRRQDAPVLLPLARAWLVAAVITFVVSLAIVYRISFDGPAAILFTVVPLILGAAMAVAFLAPLRDWSGATQAGATFVTIVSWSIVMFDNTNWSMLTFALYALSFASGRIRGIALAAVISVIWTVALVSADELGWALIGPTAALAVGAVISITLWGASEENATQSALIAKLRAAQEELALSEREKGILEERARFAGEIHDTLAQGFTSIVLVSRATQRNEQWTEGLAAIEETAESNLKAARRLVHAIGPAELDAATLSDALQRQMTSALTSDVAAELKVIGDPRPLTGTLEVTLLRAAQEALLNIRTHAKASEVHLTLTYLDDLVVLDVQDNGVGFSPGTTSDRGALTGGQGLKALEHRASTLGGQLTIETTEGSGSVLSVQLPTPRS